VSALDNAKAAREAYLHPTGKLSLADRASAMARSLRFLIAEHERVLAERAGAQEWEYGWRDLAGDDFIAESRGVAERFVAYWGGRALRRHPAIPATPWEPLPEDTNQPEGVRDA
jgi:hypothetical protein